VTIGGDWLTESEIIDAEQLEVTAMLGVIRLQRGKRMFLRHKSKAPSQLAGISIIK
jgi:hypothetical protein